MSQFWKRQLSWNCRFTRKDLLFSIAVFWIGIEILYLAFGNPSGKLPLIGTIVFYCLFGNVVLAASKRCRDVDIEPWIAILMVLIFPCMIYLLCGKGSVGANRYGPNPRNKKE